MNTYSVWSRDLPRRITTARTCCGVWTGGRRRWSAFEQALRLDSGNAEVHNNYGSLMSELGRHAEALAAYERALAVNPRYAEAHNNRGNAWRSLGRPEEALQAYGEAISDQT